MTPSGIEPATFRFVAQHLNHCATVPIFEMISEIQCEFCFEVEFVFDAHLIFIDSFQQNAKTKFHLNLCSILRNVTCQLSDLCCMLSLYV